MANEIIYAAPTEFGLLSPNVFYKHGAPLELFVTDDEPHIVIGSERQAAQECQVAWRSQPKAWRKFLPPLLTPQPTHLPA